MDEPVQHAPLAAIDAGEEGPAGFGGRVDDGGPERANRFLSLDEVENRDAVKGVLQDGIEQGSPDTGTGATSVLTRLSIDDSKTVFSR